MTSEKSSNVQTLRDRLVLFFRHRTMKSDLVKLIIAALVAYFTAQVAIEARLATVEADRRNDRQLIEKIDNNVGWLVKEFIETAATVRRLDRQQNPER